MSNNQNTKNKYLNRPRFSQSLGDDLDIKEIFTPKLTVKKAIEIFGDLKEHPDLVPTSRLHGKFMYEFLPTIALTSKLHAQFFTVTDDTAIPYDAILHLNKSDEIKVEWVSALQHREAKSKLEQMGEYGFVAQAQHLEDMEQVCKENLTDLIINSFMKKQEKLERGHYSSDLILGIVYDDFGLEHDIAREAIEKAKSVICSTKSFAAIHFITLREVYNIVEFNISDFVIK